MDSYWETYPGKHTMANPTGPAGEAGPTGIYGLQGPEGPKGVRGLIGPVGWSGFTYAQVFANKDDITGAGVSYRAPSGSGNQPPLRGSNSTTIEGLTVYDNTSLGGGCNANNVFLVPRGQYLIQAMSATKYYAQVFNQTGVPPYWETYLALSTCSSPTGGSESNLMIGASAKQNANTYLSGMFYFGAPTYVGLRQYGGGGLNGDAISPYQNGYGQDGSLNNVMLSFLKI